MGVFRTTRHCDGHGRFRPAGIGPPGGSGAKGTRAVAGTGQSDPSARHRRDRTAGRGSGEPSGRGRMAGHRPGLRRASDMPNRRLCAPAGRRAAIRETGPGRHGADSRPGCRDRRAAADRRPCHAHRPADAAGGRSGGGPFAAARWCIGAWMSIRSCCPWSAVRCRDRPALSCPPCGTGPCFGTTPWLRSGPAWRNGWNGGLRGRGADYRGRALARPRDRMACRGGNGASPPPAGSDGRGEPRRLCRHAGAQPPPSAPSRRRCGRPHRRA